MNISVIICSGILIVDKGKDEKMGIVEEFKNDLGRFREMTEKFYNKEISVKEYKGFSGGFGSYAQKGGEASMLRLRLAGGRVTKEKLGFVAKSLKEYEINKLHFTTCQTIQLHNLNADTVYALMEEALDYGIITKGGGGDFPRNVMVSPLSGVEKEEYFDVMPYGEAAGDYLLSLIDKIKLPRKLKVAFSNTPANAVHATFRDLGFVAKEDGTFDVYSAGGLGNNPKMGVCVAEGIEPSKVLYYIRAMVNTFIKYGNYDNRAKARTRYMQDTLGTEGYKEAYLEELKQVMAEEELELSVAPTVITKTGTKAAELADRMIEQKQEGLYAVSYHPIGGCPAPERIIGLYETIKDMDQVELRIAPDETVYIINLTEEEAKEVLKATEDGAKTLIESSVACIGNSICQQGLRDSQAMLQEILEKTGHLKDGSLPRIHISGCVSSCGTHQIGMIGFHGGVKRVDNQTCPAFTLHVNGNDETGKEQFGQSLGVMLQKDIPDFMKELGETIEKADMSFNDWYAENEEEFKTIAEKYMR